MKVIKILLHIIICLILITYTNVCEQDFFDLNNQVTYLGVLFGFALTLYTFGISTLKDIYSNIDKLTFKDIRKKSRVISMLRDVFAEIQVDIKIIFLGIISVFVNYIAKTTVNPFGWNVEEYNLPCFFSLLIFTLTTHAIYDIMNCLFIMST